MGKLGLFQKMKCLVSRTYDAYWQILPPPLPPFLWLVETEPNEYLMLTYAIVWLKHILHIILVYLLM